VNLEQRWRPVRHTSDVIRHCVETTAGQTLLIDGSGTADMHELITVHNCSTQYSAKQLVPTYENFCGCTASPFVSSLPSFLSSPFSTPFNYSQLFPRPQPSLSPLPPSTNFSAFFGLKSVSGLSNSSAVHEITKSAHRAKHFRRKNAPKDFAPMYRTVLIIFHFWPPYNHHNSEAVYCTYVPRH